MEGLGRGNDRGAEGGGDGLVAEADAQQRRGGDRRPGRRRADPGVGGGAGPGEITTPAGPNEAMSARHFVVADDLHPAAGGSEKVRQVVGEGVVVVDQDRDGRRLPPPFLFLMRGWRRAGAWLGGGRRRAGLVWAGPGDLLAHLAGGRARLPRGPRPPGGAVPVIDRSGLDAVHGAGDEHLAGGLQPCPGHRRHVTAQARQAGPRAARPLPWSRRAAAVRPRAGCAAPGRSPRTGSPCRSPARGRRRPRSAAARPVCRAIEAGPARPAAAGRATCGAPRPPPITAGR